MSKDLCEWVFYDGWHSMCGKVENDFSLGPDDKPTGNCRGCGKKITVDEEGK